MPGGHSGGRVRRNAVRGRGKDQTGGLDEGVGGAGRRGRGKWRGEGLDEGLGCSRRGGGSTPELGDGASRPLRQGRSRRGSRVCRGKERGRGVGGKGEEGNKAGPGRRAVCAAIAVQGSGVRCGEPEVEEKLGWRWQTGGGQGAVTKGVQGSPGVELLSELRTEAVQGFMAKAVSILSCGPGGSHLKIGAPGRVRKTRQSADLLDHCGPVVVAQDGAGGVSPVASAILQEGQGRGVWDCWADGGHQGGDESGDDGQRLGTGDVGQVVGCLDGRKDEAVLKGKVRVM
jgi:hypothetical protein